MKILKKNRDNNKRYRINKMRKKRIYHLEECSSRVLCNKKKWNKSKLNNNSLMMEWEKKMKK